MSRVRSTIGLVVVLAAMVAAGSLGMAGWRAVKNPRPLAQSVLSSFDSPADASDTTPRTFVIRSGETASAISDRLEAAHLVQHGLVFRLMAEGEGVTGDLAAGEYSLAPSMRPSEILATLTSAKTKPNPLVTIPEGWRSEEIAERLASKGIGTSDQFMALVRQGSSDSPLLAGRPTGASLEGYLFPDSYSYDTRTSPDDMARRMVQQFQQRFTPEMKAKAATLGMSVHQVVTLASIIEREAVVPSERPLMAGVFYNRLKQGMLLQTDPTVQYAVATADPQSHVQYGWWKQTLTRQDLEMDSPYNSYKYPGLPPGPICNPGLASLQAAVEPASTDYLYFVARPDGTHAFAATLEEHNQNVAKYR